MHYKNCPICSLSIKPWKNKTVNEINYNIDLCGSCGYAFVNPRPSLNFLINYYSSLEGKIDDRNEHSILYDNINLQSILAEEKVCPNSTIDAKNIVNKIKSLVQKKTNSKFLDVGCGCGFFSKEALNKDFEVVALELSSKAREITKELTGLNSQRVSFEEFENIPNSFDVILMSHILEHAMDINLWIKKAHTLLNDQGIVAIALPNFGSIFRMIKQENEYYILPPEHLNFFSPYSLSKLLEKNNFKVESVQYVTRIPTGALEKRFPKLFIPFIRPIIKLSCKVFDIFHLGLFIHIYARKIK